MSIVQETTVLQKIRSRGYWKVVIRPTAFEERRIPQQADLYPIVRDNSVQLRGWDYPHVDHSSPPQRGDDWVGQEYDRGDDIEVWRLYQSGLFVHFFTIAGDWRDRSICSPADEGWDPGREIFYLATLNSFVEIFEFAARLALSPAGAGVMRVHIEMEGLKDRRLSEQNRAFRFHKNCRFDGERWEHAWEGPQADLIAGRRELAAVAARDLFARFGLEVSGVMMRELQKRMAR